MIVTFDVYCLERELTIAFGDSYAGREDEILAALEKAYQIWCDPSVIEDPIEYSSVHCSCCEEYMMECLADAGYVCEEWVSIENDEKEWRLKISLGKDD